jgi:hypothetical protein
MVMSNVLKRCAAVARPNISSAVRTSIGKARFTLQIAALTRATAAAAT